MLFGTRIAASTDNPGTLEMFRIISSNKFQDAPTWQGVPGITIVFLLFLRNSLRELSRLNLPVASPLWIELSFASVTSCLLTWQYQIHRAWTCALRDLMPMKMVFTRAWHGPFVFCFKPQPCVLIISFFYVCILKL